MTALRVLWTRGCARLLPVAVAIFASSAAPAQSLNDALVQAYEHNPQLLAERAQLRATDEDLPQALANWRPSVQISTAKGFGSEQLSGGTPLQDLLLRGQLPTGAYGVTVTEPIFRGFRTVSESREARFTIFAERFHLVSVEQTVLLQVITDYADVARDQAGLGLQTDNEHVLAQRVVSAKAQLAGGTLTRLDVAQTEADYEGAVAQRHLAEAELEASRANFLRDTGIAPGALVYPAIAVKLPPDGEKVAETARKLHPDVISADFKLRAAREAVTVIVGQALPTISAQANYETENDSAFKGSHTTVAAIQLQLNWPIYQGGTIEAQARQDEQTVTQRFHEFEEARDKAGSDAATAWSRLIAQRAAVGAYKQQVSADETARTGTEIQQKGGERTILDVLNAQRALLQARGQLNTTIHDEIVEEYTFAAALGTLSARSLRLHIPYYDPSANFEDVEDRWFGFGIDEDR